MIEHIIGSWILGFICGIITIDFVNPIIKDMMQKR